MPDSTVEVRESLPLPLRPVPWKWVSRIANHTQNDCFERYIARADPANTICYFWPNAPIELINRAKDRGIMTVREMINTYRGTAKNILDAAYAQLGLQPNHDITDASVALEKRELSLYDYVFACSQQVGRSLADAGVSSERILPTSFGWTPASSPIKPRHNDSNSLNVLFVGSAGVRKGLPQLLEAWAKSKISGQLIIAGRIEDDLKSMADRYRLGYNVKFLNFVSNVDTLYEAADLFVLPTFEEGAPLVIYEAAGAGLPVITTPMGSAGLIKDGINGLIVNAGDVEALSNAMIQLASSSEMRAKFSSRIAGDAAEFTYAKVGQHRIAMLNNLLATRPSSADNFSE
jgi:glycosyltransferase involved in cell wall biosynthesis